MIKKVSANIFSAALALAATVAFFLWVFSDDDASGIQQDNSGAASPEWYWQNASFWNYDLEGRLQQEATASDAKYFGEEDIIYLTDPRITTHSDSESPWYTRSERGQVRHKHDIIELSQDVQIRKGDGEIDIRTERLVLTRSKDMAETDAPISIIGDTGRTDAVGMRAFLKQEKIELLSKVKTIHEPE
jgi:lipopolysaccharide export system protein LptC